MRTEVRSTIRITFKDNFIVNHFMFSNKDEKITCTLLWRSQTLKEAPIADVIGSALRSVFWELHCSHISYERSLGELLQTCKNPRLFQCQMCGSTLRSVFWELHFVGMFIRCSTPNSQKPQIVLVYLQACFQSIRSCGTFQKTVGPRL